MIIHLLPALEWAAGTAALRLCYIAIRMPQTPQNFHQKNPGRSRSIARNARRRVSDPLTCGDCSAVICRRCGTPLESPDELGIG